MRARTRAHSQRRVLLSWAWSSALLQRCPWESSCSLTDAVLGSHCPVCLLLKHLMRGFHRAPGTFPSPQVSHPHLACLALPSASNLIGQSLCVLRCRRAERPCVVLTGPMQTVNARRTWTPLGILGARVRARLGSQGHPARLRECQQCAGVSTQVCWEGLHLEAVAAQVPPSQSDGPAAALTMSLPRAGQATSPAAAGAPVLWTAPGLLPSSLHSAT